MADDDPFDVRPNEIPNVQEQNGIPASGSNGELPPNRGKYWNCE